MRKTFPENEKNNVVTRDLHDCTQCNSRRLKTCMHSHAVHSYIASKQYYASNNKFNVVTYRDMYIVGMHVYTHYING